MIETREWTPGRLLKTSGSYWQACTLHAAVKLGLFSILERQEEATAREVADRLRGDVRGVSTLLDALSAMKLVTKRGDRYGNTPFSRAYLVQDSPRYLGYMVMHHHHLVKGWERLDQAVLSGRPSRQRGDVEKERESFLMGMFNMAMGIAPKLSAIFSLTGRRHLLDLGGGPGTYAIHFCLANPGLKATVADLPESRPFAEKTIARFGLAERISFAPCNYLTEPIPGHYDVAWLSHILHGEGPEECRMIIGKAVSTLLPSGMLMVHDFILNETRDGPLFPAIFSLNMLVNTERGRSYSEGEIREMMAQAGLQEIQRLGFEGPNASAVLTGTKP